MAGNAKLDFLDSQSRTEGKIIALKSLHRALPNVAVFRLRKKLLGNAIPLLSLMYLCCH